jgi:hypothetical protein
MTRGRSAAALAAALLLLAGCTREPPPNQPRVTLAGGRVPQFIAIDGFNSAALDSLASRGAEPAAWRDIVRVDVASAGTPGADMPAMAGAFAIDRARVRFTPAFPFESGGRYRVRVDASRLPGGSEAPVSFEFDVTPAVLTGASTKVTGVSPRSTTLPANLLRLYVHFSAPMDRQGGARHVRLLDSDGRPVDDVFLPLDADLWNAERTRYTLLLDPGRVKTGIAPNDAMGRALVAGRQYTLVIEPAWRDATGRPLEAPYHHEFRAGPAIEAALDPSRWRVTPPRAGTRDALVVTFPHVIDEALALRAIGVESAAGALPGSASLGEDAVTWQFAPAQVWSAGTHRLVVLGILEDPSGNRIGRPFELGPSDASREVDRTAVPFMIAP